MSDAALTSTSRVRKVMTLYFSASRLARLSDEWTDHFRFKGEQSRSDAYLEKRPLEGSVI